MLHEKMKKILGKKRDLSSNEQEAKMDVVKHLRDSAAEAMGHKLGGLKKVSVMSDSAEGLKHGLDKAKGIISNPEMGDMLKHAENPYGDYKSALDEHSSDQDNQEKMYQGGMAGYDEGGEVEGEDEESPEHEAMESDEEEASEHEGLDMDEIQKKIDELMALKAKMEHR